MARQIGYVVIGLGAVARTAILPAFAAAENCRLVAVVSSDRAKAQSLARDLRIAAYHYDELRQCLQRDDVNAAYLALPNSLHSDYAVEAARAGVHVLCVPPMAVTADECRRMIRTSQTNRVKLMIGYRLAFRPAMLDAIARVRAGHIGVPKTFSAHSTRRIDDPDSTWLQRRLGGGTLYHLGVDCIHAARSVLGPEPAQVMAMTARMSRRYGGDVDESAVALIRFPDERLAHVHTAFGEDPASGLTIFGEEGWIRVHGAFAPDAPIRLELVRGGDRQERLFEPADEIAAILTYFADAIREDRTPEPSGIEGLQDTRIIEAIYRSARDGRPVTLPRLARMEPSALDDGRRSIDRHAG
jgi:glucose-fructose oxidoreductase